ncbi:RsfA family transcriptional regulator [Lentibacillus cibarius]|uniref:RsfA family transcriptional regulator n=1 Tax=Lentibacillus cibarius TaxID=2583219 RepID=A0A5S3QNF6_9BACI|nr:RsfA family transcriptional regulator [Lentibacillus cibarius]TMN23482.1 RsfA family transcriptional regulator [Lentibacillus cibarius]
MNAARQDAWTEDEDILLAETVLRYIRDGKTQLEAFKDVAQQLSRTSAACGFRWNASIRKQYANEIELAKEDRKKHNKPQANGHHGQAEGMGLEANPIDSAITILKKMRTGYLDNNAFSIYEKEVTIKRLEKENEVLKQQLDRYEQAWREMGKLWSWVSESEK